ncbi:polyprenyl synthetase family protein [Neisseria sp. Ec49-e6-T10]|uniref:polyprenyl synthetase family protein n=1 Tax=Neisseria sp. Ec49-e6-T10 TaxID=3140744 RepID=UPI003EC12E8A
MLQNAPASLLQQIDLGLDKVNTVINQALQSDVPLISQVGNYIICAGGKRLRPILTILSGQTLGYEKDDLYALAAMVEFIHTSTLLHDDVVDESDLRRGRQTANHLFGNAAAVLVGDFLYTRAFELMVASNNMRILEVMAKATNIIAEGEVMQLLNIGNTSITEKEYFQVIQYKTAKLFEAAAQVGAILAGATDKEENALKDYGMYLGTAFQIIDDVLDYSGDTEQTGKNVGDDLAEGKPTLPLIYVMEQGKPEDAQIIKKALEETNREHFDQVLKIVQNSGALLYAKEQATKACNQAIEALAPLKQNNTTASMIQLAQASVARLS